eukprot:scaffold227788_cov38-Prasinocladus_malaysianus.AAC.2
MTPVGWHVADPGEWVSARRLPTNPKDSHSRSATPSVFRSCLMMSPPPASRSDYSYSTVRAV